MTLIRSAGLPLNVWSPLACGILDVAALQREMDEAAQKLLDSLDTALFSLPESTLRTSIYNARKDFYRSHKAPPTRLLDMIQDLPEWSELRNAIHHWQKALESKRVAEIQFEQNLLANYRELQRVARNETLQRALLFASHDLLNRLPGFANKALEQLDKKDRQTAFSLLQYLNRAVFKTSPLSRFTTLQLRRLSEFGHKVMHQEDASDTWPAERPGVKALLVPNVALLPAIYEVLLREPAFFQLLRLSLNPCVVGPLQTGSSWLFFNGVEEAFQQIQPEPVADLLVGLLLENDRELPFLEIMRRLGNEVDADEKQLQGFVFQLVDIGLLEWKMPEQGISNQWCTALYHYLSYLPTAPALTEAAFLLQWLRTAARTLPFQSLEAAQGLQKAAVQECKKFLESHDSQMPPIPPEQIFFEDVAEEDRVDLPSGTLEMLASQLADCWRQKAMHRMSAFRSKLYQFARDYLKEGEAIDFLTFSQRFLEAWNQLGTEQLDAPSYSGKMGALLQVFEENGNYKAVVNALYPGGGKLFARWLPLFPASLADMLRDWAVSDDCITVPFPRQGWSNANFQPMQTGAFLAVPDGRVGGSERFLLGNLLVRISTDGVPRLFVQDDKRPIVFNDLGLEAPETRPPAMQVLWHLGVPQVSSAYLLPESWATETKGGTRHRRRLEFQSLVLARAAWELPPEVWETLFSRGNSQAERIGLGIVTLKNLGIPVQFFGRFSGRREKPQFYDLASPISMLLLEKNLKSGAGSLLITEMLPVPEQLMGEKTREFVLEFETRGFG